MNLVDAIKILKRHNEHLIKHSKWDFNEPITAIDTVLSLINTENKTGLDENLLEKGIEQPDNQASLSYKKVDTYTAEEMEAFALWVNENYAIEPERSSPKQIIWYEHGFMDSEEFTLTQLRELWEKERRAK